MNKHQLMQIVASDNQCILRDKETKFNYFIKRMIYKLILKVSL